MTEIEEAGTDDLVAELVKRCDSIVISAVVPDDNGARRTFMWTHGPLPSLIGLAYCQHRQLVQSVETGDAR